MVAGVNVLIQEKHKPQCLSEGCAVNNMLLNTKKTTHCGLRITKDIRHTSIHINKGEVEL